MLKTDLAVIVEGKYDKIKLASLLDALIVSTEGFGVFSDKELQHFLRKLAETKGILVITDSDAAGFRIRSFIHSIAAKGTVIDAYIPDIQGKESRKDAPSKEGKLGVEGIPAELILQAVERAGVGKETDTTQRRLITNADLYEYGFTGTPNASDRRRALLKKAGLPARLCGSNLLKTINAFMSYEDFLVLAETING
ncbi:MAG: DUF4093 domain-containing protein [Ruminococcaceae bacterium]|nr:DUF4093 domain-containing protein [Oscillospiraceae bacterium]